MLGNMRNTGVGKCFVVFLLVGFIFVCFLNKLFWEMGGKCFFVLFLGWFCFVFLG